MAPIVELNSARFNFHRTYTKVRDISNKVILDLPIIGPIKRNMPGRKESLLISTVIPLGVGLVEWGLYEGLRQTGIDPIALGLVTLGVLYATKEIERRALVEREKYKKKVQTHNRRCEMVILLPYKKTQSLCLRKL